MPPRTFRDLTEEELEELERDFVPRARVPKLPAGALASVDTTPLSRMEIGDIEMGGPGSDDAWLDELIANPPQTAQRPMFSAAGPGGAFAGEDTPQARALAAQRGMQVTDRSAPSDEELLDPSVFKRPATMPDLEDEGWLDELIAAEGAEMDREQPAPFASGGAGAPQRRSREDELLEVLQPPSKLQGWLAVLGDSLYGGQMVEGVNARQRSFEGARAQARLQDIAAGERADERAADRGMTDARLAVTLRGQDLADARAEQARRQQLELAERTDKRIREESALGRNAAMERARIMAEGRARNEAPVLPPDQERAGLAGYLAGEANTTLAEAEAYLAGKTEGLAPGKAERLRGIDAQLKTLPPALRATTRAQAMGRVAADRDRKEPERLESRNELLALHRKVNEAEAAWKAMSDKDKRVLAQVGGGDSWLASTARDAMLSAEGQKLAASIQALADMQIKLQSGASVTANEWRRVATEIGLPKDAFSPFNATDSIDSWIKKSKDGFRDTYDSTLSTYPDLFDDMQGAR
ncbi:MAG TPA: hypothetical protein VED01_03245 [Burkholderiales bacterium]|nr:hypothetical protein [Burkholderiales bacterium]